MLEAMATGAPCVATDAPGTREVVSRGGGILVAQDDIGGLAAALDRLAGDPDECDRLGAEGRRVVDADCSIERVAEQYVATYTSLIRGSAPARHP